jgi:hypothetical protein
MPNSTKIGIAVVAVIIIVGGIWWWNMSAPQPQPAVVENTPSGGTVANGNNPTQGGAILASGNSDTALDQNLAQVDAQLSALSSDSASVDQGLNDQPVAQTTL